MPSATHSYMQILYIRLYANSATMVFVTVVVLKPKCLPELRIPFDRRKAARLRKTGHVFASWNPRKTTKDDDWRPWTAACTRNMPCSCAPRGHGPTRRRCVKFFSVFFSYLEKLNEENIRKHPPTSTKIVIFPNS